MCDAELKLEANDGEDVTISFKTDELNRANQVKITFTRQSQKYLIAQYCRCAHCGDCDVVETPGVLLRVEEGTLILQDVRSRNSGLYEAKIIVGNIVSKMKVTLVVNSEYVTTIYLFIWIRIMRKNNVNGNDCFNKVVKIKLMLFLHELECVQIQMIILVRIYRLTNICR